MAECLAQTYPGYVLYFMCLWVVQMANVHSTYQWPDSAEQFVKGWSFLSSFQYIQGGRRKRRGGEAVHFKSYAFVALAFTTMAVDIHLAMK